MLTASEKASVNQILARIPLYIRQRLASRWLLSHVHSMKVWLFYAYMAWWLVKYTDNDCPATGPVLDFVAMFSIPFWKLSTEYQGRLKSSMDISDWSSLFLSLLQKYISNDTIRTSHDKNEYKMVLCTWLKTKGILHTLIIGGVT